MCGQRVKNGGISLILELTSQCGIQIMSKYRATEETWELIRFYSCTNYSSFLAGVPTKLPTYQSTAFARDHRMIFLVEDATRTNEFNGFVLIITGALLFVLLLH